MSEGAEAEANSDEWSCEACTISNSNKTNPLFCGLCFAWKGDISTWGCFACSYQNNNKRTTCAICKIKRQAVLGKRSASREVEGLRRETNKKPVDFQKFDVNESNWDEHYSALLAYKKMCGHCFVKSNYITPGGRLRLGNWLDLQKAAAVTNKLDPDQYQKLNELNIFADQKPKTTFTTAETTVSSVAAPAKNAAATHSRQNGNMNNSYDSDSIDDSTDSDNETHQSDRDNKNNINKTFRPKAGVYRKANKKYAINDTSPTVAVPKAALSKPTASATATATTAAAAAGRKIQFDHVLLHISQESRNDSDNHNGSDSHAEEVINGCSYCERVASAMELQMEIFELQLRQMHKLLNNEN